MRKELFVILFVLFNCISDAFREFLSSMLDILNSSRLVDSYMECRRSKRKIISDIFRLPGQHAVVKIHANSGADVAEHFFSLLGVNEIICLNDQWILINIFFDPLVDCDNFFETCLTCVKVIAILFRLSCAPPRFHACFR